MAVGDIGFGTKVYRGTGSGPITYTQVGEIVAVTPPAPSREVVDVTHYNSPGRYREKVGGLRDAGQMAFTIQFASPAALDLMLDDFNSDAVVPYRFEWPDGTDWDGNMFVINVVPDTPMADKITAEVTLEITGRPAFLTP